MGDKDNKSMQSSILLATICEKYNISSTLLVEMQEYGLFDLDITDLENNYVDYNTFCKIQSACRLQQDLNINVPGAVLVLELLDELKQTREELYILQRHISVNVT